MVTSIIESLSSDDELTKPLLKTLVFAKRIEHEELSSWLTKELNGYGNDDILPNYRFARTTLQSVLKQKGQQTKVVTLPLSCFNKDTIEILIKKPFSESIAVLEAVLSDKNNKYIGKDFAADMLQSLSNEVKENGHDFTIISCRQTVSITEVSSIIISIKTKLLDLLLRIEKEYAGNEDLKSPTLKSEINTTINYFMNEIYNINTDGNDNIINTGNNSRISISNELRNNNLDALKSLLANKGLSPLVTEEIVQFVKKEIITNLN